MRPAVICLIFGLSGCAELPTSGGAPMAGEAPSGAQQAYFTGYPEPLFFAAGAVCTEPGQNVVRPSRNEVRCESLLDPESTAAIILQFDGSIEDLPKLVWTFKGRDTAEGYLVTADNYLRVPQRNGEVQQVRFPSAETTQDARQLLQAAGGRPL